MDLIKKAESIRKYGIVSLIAIVFVIIWAVLMVTSMSFSMFVTWLILILVTLILVFVMEITCVIKILATDWKNSDLNSQKAIWGVLCIVVLGPISAIIFGTIAANKLKETSSIPTVEKENSNAIEESK